MAATILSSAGLRLFFDKFCLLIQLSDRFLLSAVSMLIMSTNLWPVFQDHKSHGVAEIHLNAAPPFIHFDSTKARQIETCKVSKNMKNSSVDKGESTLHSLDTRSVQVNFQKFRKIGPRDRNSPQNHLHRMRQKFAYLGTFSVDSSTNRGIHSSK